MAYSGSWGIADMEREHQGRKLDISVLLLNYIYAFP